MSNSISLAPLGRAASAALANAGRDALRGMTIVVSKTIALAGFLLLSAFFTLLVSEQAREALSSRALASLGIEPQPVSEPKPVGNMPRSGGNWSDWLATAPNGRLEPQQEHVSRYLAQRYRVADGAVRQIVGAAFSTGRAIGVDPMLILAVTAVESSLNPFAQSAVGAQGLMQVMTRLHSEKFVSHGGDHAALDPIANLKVGAEILKELISRGGSVQRGLQLYVGAGNLPDDGGYADRVLGELGRIKVAAGGNVRAALSAGWRADAQARSGAPSAEILPVGSGDAASSSRAPANRPAAST